MKRSLEQELEIRRARLAELGFTREEHYPGARLFRSQTQQLLDLWEGQLDDVPPRDNPYEEVEAAIRYGRDLEEWEARLREGRKPPRWEREPADMEPLEDERGGTWSGEEQIRAY